jgi:hypothetical protein
MVQLAALQALVASLQPVIEVLDPARYGRLRQDIQDAATQNCLTEHQDKILALAYQTRYALEERIRAEEKERYTSREKQKKAQELKQKAQKLLQDGFHQSLQRTLTWLKEENLLRQYQGSASRALREIDFHPWVTRVLTPTWQEYEQELTGWVKKATDFFQLDPPPPFTIPLVFPQEPDPRVSQPSSSFNQPLSPDLAPTLLAGGIGWVLGGPVGAMVLGGASYVLNQPEERRDPVRDYDDDVDRLAQSTAIRYLKQLSQQGTAAVLLYQEQVTPYLSEELGHPVVSESQQSPDLTQWQAYLRAIEERIVALEAL